MNQRGDPGARQPRDLAALTAVFETAFADPTAAERRKKALADDGRDAAELSARFSELDALIGELHERLEATLKAEAESVEIIEELDVEEADVIEITERLDDHGKTAGEVTPDDVPDLAPPTPPPMEEVGSSRPRRDTLTRKRRQAELLYEDVIWLLAINDGEGALISLERLLVSSAISSDVQGFLEANRTKLLNLYGGYIGPFDKTPKRQKMRKGTDMPDSYKQNSRIAMVLELVDGKRNIKKVIKGSKLTPLETCCILNQLKRSGLIAIG